MIPGTINRLISDTPSIVCGSIDGDVLSLSRCEPGYTIMTGRKNRSGSRDWAKRQGKDLYVRQARNLGLRARSAFKLSQMDRRYGLVRPDSRVVDLGCAPGSWCDYVASVVKHPGQVVGVDLLDTKPIKGVHLIKGDFTDPKIQTQIRNCFDGQLIDLVISDMAPNITGIRVTDQANAKKLQDSLLAFCQVALSHGGTVLTKVFEGESLAEIRTACVGMFSKVVSIKPDASRPKSRELYLLGTGFRR